MHGSIKYKCCNSHRSINDNFNLQFAARFLKKKKNKNKQVVNWFLETDAFSTGLVIRCQLAFKFSILLTGRTIDHDGLH